MYPKYIFIGGGGRTHNTNNYGTHLAVVAVQLERVSRQEVLPFVDILEGQVGGGHARLAALPAALAVDGENAADVEHIVIVGRGRRARAHVENYRRADPLWPVLEKQGTTVNKYQPSNSPETSGSRRAHNSHPTKIKKKILRTELTGQGNTP